MQETPSGRERMRITEPVPQLEDAQHIALDIDRAFQIGLGNDAFIEAGECLDPL